MKEYSKHLDLGLELGIGVKFSRTNTSQFGQVRSQNDLGMGGVCLMC